MHIDSIDHIVLTVKSLEITTAFYESVLGMTVQTFGEGRYALKFGNQKINLHQQGEEFEPKANRATPGSTDLCLITNVELSIAMAHVNQQGVDIIDGPVARTGATGAIISFYFRDPDLNLIEISNYVTANE